MIFAGKKRRQVEQKVISMILWYLLFAVIAVLAAAVLISIFSGRMLTRINGINQFLQKISEGDLNTELDQEVIKCRDELGTIGRHAVQMRKDLKNMIEYDPLTSLYNRRSGNKQLEELENEKADYSVVMCDIDFFKKVNDTYGHDAGDYVLIAVSALMRANVRDCGFASRWGGEEFLLVYRLGGDETKAKVEELQRQVRDYEFQYKGKSLKITMTFGIEAGNGTDSCEERIRQADDKLYVGKNNGRDRIIV